MMMWHIHYSQVLGQDYHCYSSVFSVLNALIKSILFRP